MITVAAKEGMMLLEDLREEQLACKDRCVRWNGAEYTFLSAVFKRGGHGELR